MKGSQEKLDRFPCTSCGLCCKNITGIIELVGFDAGNGGVQVFGFKNQFMQDL
ncbi:hypothetical protein MMM5_07280 [Helicobacter pylori]